jgi:imidazolonepropionase-like amidohydrolase
MTPRTDLALIELASASDVGRVRSDNQDLDLLAPPLIAVADGMGGHLGGGTASRMAVDALRAAGVPIAIASDHNPGSSPGLSMPLMLNMACTFFRLTPLEAWQGATVHAARALGLADRGTLQAGHRADLAVWALEHPRQLAYGFGHDPCRATIVGGHRTPS